MYSSQNGLHPILLLLCFGIFIAIHNISGEWCGSSSDEEHPHINKGTVCSNCCFTKWCWLPPAGNNTSCSTFSFFFKLSLNEKKRKSKQLLCILTDTEIEHSYERLKISIFFKLEHSSKKLLLRYYCLYKYSSSKPDWPLKTALEVIAINSHYINYICQ